MAGSGAHVHRLVAETAQAMAHECYDALMQRNEWYDLWKKQHPGASTRGLEELFVRKNWGKFIAGARATMAGMLQGPYDSDLKDRLYEALVLDNTLLHGRQSGAKVIGQTRSMK